MFWRRERPAEPFRDSAFDEALLWCEDQGERVTVLHPDAFDVYLGDHVVHVERHEDDGWLNAHAILPEPPLQWGETVEDRVKAYEQFADRQFKSLDVIMDLLPDGRISARFVKMMHYQGSVHWMIFNMLSTFDYLLNKDESRVVPGEAIYFYVDGRRFINASEAFQYYMRKVRKAGVIEDTSSYISFDTGGMACAVEKTGLGHEFVLRYGFSDFVHAYLEDRCRLNAHLFASAYRKAPDKVSSYALKSGVSELCISGVLTAGTESRPIFTRTLAEIYQVVLDSTERIKVNSGLKDCSITLESEEYSISQAAFFRGELTGGLVEE